MRVTILERVIIPIGGIVAVFMRRIAVVVTRATRRNS
jgi:hypothetical protein